MNTPAKSKKETKKVKTQASSEVEGSVNISNKEELRTFLLSIRDKMTEQVAAPIYAVSALNYVLNLPNVCALIDNETKEIARDIWLRIKQSGMQVRNPPFLFSADEVTPTR
jgi:hypothetical protein